MKNANLGECVLNSEDKSYPWKLSAL